MKYLIYMDCNGLKTKITDKINLPHEKVELFKTLKAKVEDEMLSARVVFC